MNNRRTLFSLLAKPKMLAFVAIAAQIACAAPAPQDKGNTSPASECADVVSDNADVTSFTWERMGPRSLQASAAAVSSRGLLAIVRGNLFFKNPDTGLMDLVSEGLPDFYWAVAIAADGDDVLLGTQGQGAFRSFDGGLTWEQRSDGLHLGEADKVLVTAVGDFALSSQEFIVRLWNEAMGLWEPVSIFWPSGSATLVDRMFFVGGYLWVGEEFGRTWRSDDLGETWELIVDGSGQFLPMAVSQMAESGDTIMAAGGWSVWQSTDGGASFLEVASPLGIGAEGLEIYATGVAPYGDGKWMVSDAYLGVYLFDAVADTWELINDGIQLYENRSFAETEWGMAFGGGDFWVLALAATYRWKPEEALWEREAGARSGFVSDVREMPNGDLLALSGTYRRWLAHKAPSSDDWQRYADDDLSDLLNPQLEQAGDIVYVATDGQGLYRSVDNGESFLPANSGVPTLNGTAGQQYWPIAKVIGSRTPAQAFMLTGFALEMINGSFKAVGAGVYRSEDGGQSWLRAADGLPVVQQSFEGPRNDAGATLFETGEGTLLASFMNTGVIFDPFFFFAG